ncbi:ataxin-10-like [Ptychodera flava]|uniref:ataxin-10-like n=1 Tax=Ptychodera flava TaxID=63121 RepID=UPI003969DB1B
MADDRISRGRFNETLAAFRCLSQETGDEKCDNEVLETLTERLKEEESRDLMTQEAFTDIKKMLCNQEMFLSKSCDRQDKSRERVLHIQVCTHCFRVLRNSCVMSTKNQDMLGVVDVLQVVKRLIYLLTSEQSPAEEQVVAVRCGVQFVGNFVSGNKSTQSLVWQQFFPEVFLCLLKFDDFKVSVYICMVIYNCLHDCQYHIQQLIKHPTGLSIVESVLMLCQRESEQEWGLFIVEELLQCQEFILTQFETLSPECKCILLDITSAKLDSTAGHREGSTTEGHERGNSEFIPAFSIAFLADVFEQQAQKLLLSAVQANTKEAGTLVESTVVLRVLRVLCVATSIQDKYGILQARTSLLETALDLLQKAHTIGKSGENVFTVRQTLSNEASRRQTTENPVFGFKGDLIRLIGNMSSRNKRNQDLVRQLEGIGLLLDHCNIDELNPFINQWAVFAIHNLCENNAENQSVIASMQQRGVVGSKVLKDMGIEVEDRDGKLYVKTSPKAEQ